MYVNIIIQYIIKKGIIDFSIEQEKINISKHDEFLMKHQP